MRRYKWSTQSAIPKLAKFFKSERFAGKHFGYSDLINPVTQILPSDGLTVTRLLREQGVSIHSFPWKDAVSGVRGIRVGDKEFDVIFRNYMGNWFITNKEEHRNLLEDFGKLPLEMIDPPYDKLLRDKMMLVFLSDPQYDSFLNDEEEKVCQDCLPWTRLLRAHRTRFEGTEVNVIDLVGAQKDRFLIKNGMGFQAKGVIAGADVDQRTWDENLKSALADGSWVIQEKVDFPKQKLPYIVDGNLEFAPVTYLASPFIIDREFGGFMVSTSQPEGGVVFNIDMGISAGTTGVVVLEDSEDELRTGTGLFWKGKT